MSEATPESGPGPKKDNKEPEITDLDGEKLMYMCAMESVRDALDGKGDAKSAKLSLDVIMSGLASKMPGGKDFEDAKNEDNKKKSLLAERLIAVSSRLNTSLQLFHTNVESYNSVIKTLLRDIDPCDNCGAIHHDQKTVPVEIEVMHCTVCQHEFLPVETAINLISEHGIGAIGKGPVEPKCKSCGATGDALLKKNIHTRNIKSCFPSHESLLNIMTPIDSHGKLTTAAAHLTDNEVFLNKLKAVEGESDLSQHGTQYTADGDEQLDV